MNNEDDCENGCPILRAVAGIILGIALVVILYKISTTCARLY